MLLAADFAVAGQQLHQRRSDAAEVVAALGGTNEQSLDCRGGRYEAVSGAVTAGGVLLCEQSRDVRGILYLRALVEAAGMAGALPISSRCASSSVSMRRTWVWGIE